jgi:methionine-gamma-lyase
MTGEDHRPRGERLQQAVEVVDFAGAECRPLATIAVAAQVGKVERGVVEQKRFGPIERVDARSAPTVQEDDVQALALSVGIVDRIGLPGEFPHRHHRSGRSVGQRHLEVAVRKAKFVRGTREAAGQRERQATARRIPHLAHDQRDVERDDNRSRANEEDQKSDDLVEKVRHAGNGRRAGRGGNSPLAARHNTRMSQSSPSGPRSGFHPIESLATLRHEFGEHGGVNMSIEASTTFTVMDAETMPRIFHGERGPDIGGCYLYGRHFNPTVYVLGRQIAAMEGMPSGYCTGSGMAAIAGVLTQLCDAGDHIVSSGAVYGGTFALMNDYFPKKTGVRTAFVDITNLTQVEAACGGRTKVLYAESLSNPTLRIADIPALAAIAKRKGLTLVVDNTFCPLIVSPAELGAQVVVHSLTKFVSGASDIVAGAVCGTQEFITQLMDVHTGSLMLLGPTMDPKVAHELSLRVPHLGLRVAEHSRRALTFATRLRERGAKVVYPGLSDHPDHALAKRLFREEFGFGGLFTLDVGSKERAFRLMELLQNRDRFGYMAVSLGYFDTLMSCSASSTSSELSDDALRAAGISPGLLRISIGYTGSLEQRWAQLEDALRQL